MARVDEKFFKMNDDMQANKVSDILDPDENILLQLKPKKSAYIWSSIISMLPLVLFWLAFDIVAIVMFAQNGASDGDGGSIVFTIIFFGLHLIPVWLWIKNIIVAVIGHKNIEYVFTEKRIIIRSGIIGIDFKSIYYSDVSGVNVKVAFVDKLFKVGDIYIKANNQSAVLNDIQNPYFILSKLQQITLDIKADIYYPNNLRPEENDGYNTKYTRK